eukprot:996429-Rhodomonas_salina.1
MQTLSCLTTRRCSLREAESMMSHTSTACPVQLPPAQYSVSTESGLCTGLVRCTDCTVLTCVCSDCTGCTVLISFALQYRPRSPHLVLRLWFVLACPYRSRQSILYVCGLYWPAQNRPRHSVLCFVLAWWGPVPTSSYWLTCTGHWLTADTHRLMAKTGRLLANTRWLTAETRRLIANTRTDQAFAAVLND